MPRRGAPSWSNARSSRPPRKPSAAAKAPGHRVENEFEAYLRREAIAFCDTMDTENLAKLIPAVHTFYGPVGCKHLKVMDAAPGRENSMKRLWLIAALVPLSCGGGGSAPTSPTRAVASTPTPTPTPTPASRALYSISVSPDPIRSFPGTDGARWIVEFDVTVTEHNGLSGNMNWLNASIYSQRCSRSNTLNIGANDINALLGSNFIDARDQITLPLRLVYNCPDRVQEMHFEVDITDARAWPHRVTSIVQVLSREAIPEGGP
jgi:hypothetical protein